MSKGTQLFSCLCTVLKVLFYGIICSTKIMQLVCSFVHIFMGGLIEVAFIFEGIRSERLNSFVQFEVLQ